MAGKGDIKKADIQPNLNPRWDRIEFEQALEKTTITHKLKSNDFFFEGIFPVVDQGSVLVSGYVNEEDILYKGELPIVVFGDHTRNIKFIDFEFAVGADGTKILKSKKGIDVKFLYYYLKSLRIPDFGYSRHYSIFKFLDFPLPPLAEQERLVAKLDALFAQLEVMKKALERIPKLLRDFRQQVLTQAVTGQFVKPKFTGSFEDYSINISTGPFGSALHQSDYINNGIPVINPSHIRNGEIVPDHKVSINQVKYESLKSWHLIEGDVILGRRGEMGRAAYKVGNENMLCGTGSILLRSNKMDFRFLTYYLRSEFCVNYLINNSVGSTMINLNQKILKSLPIPIYDISEQQEIVTRVESLFAKADMIQVRYQKLKEKINTLPQVILHKAFKGELVAQLPTDGDSKDLLAEIMKLKKQQKGIRSN
jgi:restriction endonuclease S subunit